MLKWLKVVVLLAGGLGVLGFFLPFFVFDLGNRKVNATGYELAFGSRDPVVEKLATMKVPLCAKARDTGEQLCAWDEVPSTRSVVPLYFLSTIAFLLASVHAIWRKRMDLFGGLTVLAASLFAIGCWLHEFNSSHYGVSHDTARRNVARAIGLARARARDRDHLLARAGSRCAVQDPCPASAHRSAMTRTPL